MNTIIESATENEQPSYYVHGQEYNDIYSGHKIHIHQQAIAAAKVGYTAIREGLLEAESQPDNDRVTVLRDGLDAIKSTLHEQRQASKQALTELARTTVRIAAAPRWDYGWYPARRVPRMPVDNSLNGRNHI